MSRPLPRLLAAAATTALLTSTLGACGGDSVTIPTGDGGSVNIDRDGGDISIETEDGTITGGASGTLPDGFPKDDIPLVPGNILSALAVNTGDQKGWSVTVTPSSPGGAKAAVALLTAQGFTVQYSGEAGTGSTTSLQSDTWSVVIAATGAEGDSTISYVVAPNEQ